MRIKLLPPVVALVATAALTVASVPASAASSGALDATVTVASPCILLDQPSVDFGSLGFSSTAAPTNGTRTAKLTNCGGQAETIAARGTDAIVGADVWTLIPNRIGPERVTNPC